MGVDSFEIESYHVRAAPREYYTHTLSFRSPESIHGSRRLTTIFFMAGSKLPAVRGWAIFDGGVLFDDRVIYAYADEKYFESMYHVLQTEKPVSFHYNYYPSNSPGHELFSFDLTTAAEPTGEGMAEKGLQALVSAGELDLKEIDAEELGVEDLDALRPPEEFLDLE